MCMHLMIEQGETRICVPFCTHDLAERENVNSADQWPILSNQISSLFLNNCMMHVMCSMKAMMAKFDSSEK